jgi:Mor family transcriptional regulator
VLTRAEIVAKAGQANAAKTILTKRNTAMVEMADRGYSWVEIAKRFNVSKQRVYAIVTRERKRKAA